MKWNINLYNKKRNDKIGQIGQIYTILSEKLSIDNL